MRCAEEVACSRDDVVVDYFIDALSRLRRTLIGRANRSYRKAECNIAGTGLEDASGPVGHDIAGRLSFNQCIERRSDELSGLFGRKVGW